MSKRNRNRNRKSEAVTTTAMAVAAPITDNSGLDNLLAAILPPTTDQPAPVAGSADPVVAVSIDDGDLQAAINAAEVQEHYSATPAEQPAPAASEPTTDAATTEKVADAPKKAKRSKLTDEEKQKRADALALKKKEREEKREKAKAEAASRPKRIYFGANKVERMKHTIGEDTLKDMAVLTVADAALSGEELTKRQEEVIASIGAMSSKVKNRATYLMEFAAGKKASLNSIIKIAFETLAKDGFIKTGDGGNYHAALLAKPYNVGTARAAGNNTVSLLKQLQVLIPGTEKATYVPNPDSLMLGKIMGSLGLSLPSAS